MGLAIIHQTKQYSYTQVVDVMLKISFFTQYDLSETVSLKTYNTLE